MIYKYVQQPQVTEFKSDYQNHLYECALQNNLNVLTTPYNVNTQKENVNYDKIVNLNFGEKILRVIVKGIVATFGSMLNFFGFGLKVIGRENLNGIKSAVVVSNHVHYVDCLWNLRVLKGKKLYITGAPHNWKKGFGGKILKAGGIVPMPTSFSQGKAFLDAAQKLLAKPALLQFNPEQSLWLRYEQSRPFKKGAFICAAENNVPVVPVIYTFKKSHFRRKKKVIAHIGKPIYAPDSLSKAQACEYLKQKAQEFYDNTIIDFYGYEKQTYAMNKINYPKK